ncbi:lysophospholipase [Croceibacterium mercuriale]|uniref:Lysophospholipase n=1 Tax=Croceibacterium mercuriale TaxID=1572751 RepID=A0A0B2BV36_9SPHN|nr:alpha/beta hydrolase [Croceibacterium mercuriale]KHL25264.1 lysophospholipase [Croceibacterium mercuriale]
MVTTTGELRAFDRRHIPDGARESRWRAGDGHLIRQLDWTPPDGPPRGSLLFLCGRGDAYEKYLETLEHWRGQGWQAGAAEWRGQGGSGRLGLDATTGHIDDFAAWLDDLAAFWRDWTARHPGPHVLAGHSMGGHLVLRALAERMLDPAPAALVLSAPMLDIGPDALPGMLKRALAATMVRVGDPRRPAWKASEKPGGKVLSRQTLLTHCDDRYADELWWRGARPELAMGPGSWGWMAGAVRSIRRLDRAGLLEAVTTPCCIIATPADRLVSPRAIRRTAARLPWAELHWFAARHELLREVDAIRVPALAAIDTFLDRVTAA